MNITRLLGALQIVAVAFQGAPDVIHMIPEPWHPLLHFGVGLVQALGWWAQRGYNPDGVKTPGEKGQ